MSRSEGLGTAELHPLLQVELRLQRAGSVQPSTVREGSGG